MTWPSGREFLFELDRRLDTDQSLNRIDIRLTAQRDRAVAHGHVEHPPRTIEDVGVSLLTFEQAGDANRFREGAGAIR